MSTIVYLRRSKRPSLFATLGATALIAVKPVFAQDDNTNTNTNTNTEAAPAPTNTNDDESSEETSAATLPNEETGTTEAPAATNTNTEEEADSSTTEEDEPTTTAEEETTATEDVSITNTGTVLTTGDMTNAPTITGGPQPTDEDGGLSNAPTLTRGFGIPEYPAASVPPTYHAPFMQHSQAPDGTVFIAVGAILGAFALAILLWRIIVSLLLHRSVEKAALAQQNANSKSGFPAPPAPFYKYTDQSSTMSLGQARGNRKSRGPIPSANLSQSNLFFSPTAAGHGSASNRASAYLPSGFYAAGHGNQSHTHSISLTNLRPDSRGHGARESRITPPDSPSFAGRRDLSGSSLHLAPQPGQRAPSAYLEDLLADDPSALPPPHMPPTTGPSRHASGRF